MIDMLVPGGGGVCVEARWRVPVVGTEEDVETAFNREQIIHENTDELYVTVTFCDMAPSVAYLNPVIGIIMADEGLMADELSSKKNLLGWLAQISNTAEDAERGWGGVWEEDAPVNQAIMLSAGEGMLKDVKQVWCASTSFSAAAIDVRPWNTSSLKWECDLCHINSGE
ncbi:hypothetical protein MUK42_35854 [Musa troglodytarum]|uniref:Uncharacterized protein n=1 Tax=Musa troglodytarum TaxID=320322 RepID=A0A9E7KWY9_9LILI|nr:hypothetical protein MUK42_35854 [Musa troglodytarum]